MSTGARTLPRWNRKPQKSKPSLETPRRPRVKDLRECYKGLITLSIANRISTLASALQWYDNATRYLISKKRLQTMMDGRVNYLSKVAHARAHAIKQQEDAAKENALIETIKWCERLCAPLHPPFLMEYYFTYAVKESTLERRKERLEKRSGRVVKLLEQATGNRLKIEIADAHKLAQYNPALTTISYNRAAVRAMTRTLKEDGFLAVFINELPRLTRQAILDPDWKGGWKADESRYPQAYQDLLGEFIKFCKSGAAPRQLVKRARQNDVVTSGSSRERKGEK